MVEVKGSSAIGDRGQATISLTPDVDGLHFRIFESSKLERSYLVDLLYSMWSSANSGTFMSSFPVWIHFILFHFILFYFSLVAVARTCNTMLNKSGKSGHPCLVPYLRGNIFSFSSLRMMLAVDLSYMAFIMLSYVSSIPLLEV